MCESVYVSVYVCVYICAYLHISVCLCGNEFIAFASLSCKAKAIECFDEHTGEKGADKICVYGGGEAHLSGCKHEIYCYAI